MSEWVNGWLYGFIAGGGLGACLGVALVLRAACKRRVGPFRDGDRP